MIKTHWTNLPNEGVAPINELPAEILVKVFKHTINTAYDQWNTRSSTLLTLILCSVCSRWRNLIVGNAVFWACVPVGNGPNSGRLTELFLNRSQDSGLIDIVAFARDPNSQITWQAQTQLRSHVHRFRSLSIFVASFPLVYSLLHFALNDQVPPFLVHLYLMARVGYNQLPELALASTSYQQNFVRLCSQLHILEMNNVWFNFNSYSFGRLEKLAINYGLPEAMDSISTAPRLRFLDIRDISSWDPQERTDPEPVQGAKVLRIRRPHPFSHWERYGPRKDWDIIDLHFPNNLTTGRNSEIKSKLECLDQYMRLYSSKIGLLTLCNDRPEILNRVGSMIIQDLPNLHTLTFNELELTESILSRFIPPPESLETFPKFHTLRLLLSDVCHLGTFRTLIMSHPIRCLYLWRSRLDWGNGMDIRSYRPDGPSPLYEWLCEYVPELYILIPEEGTHVRGPVHCMS
ncbi:hypothetical protein ACGC1H_004387 [Rhizoctonia solani]